MSLDVFDLEGLYNSITIAVIWISTRGKAYSNDNIIYNFSDLLELEICKS